VTVTRPELAREAVATSSCAAGSRHAAREQAVATATDRNLSTTNQHTL